MKLQKKVGANWEDVRRSSGWRGNKNLWDHVDHLIPGKAKGGRFRVVLSKRESGLLQKVCVFLRPGKHAGCEIADLIFSSYENRHGRELRAYYLEDSDGSQIVIEAN